MGYVREIDAGIFKIQPEGHAVQTMALLISKSYSSLDEALAAIEEHTRGVCRHASRKCHSGGENDDCGSPPCSLEPETDCQAALIGFEPRCAKRINFLETSPEFPLISRNQSSEIFHEDDRSSSLMRFRVLRCQAGSLCTKTCGLLPRA